MNCRTVKKLTTLFLYGELDDAGIAAVRQHLRDCVSCRDRMDALRGVVEAVRIESRERPPAHVLSELAGKLEAERLRREAHVGVLSRLVATPWPGLAIVLMGIVLMRAMQAILPAVGAGAGVCRGAVPGGRVGVGAGRVSVAGAGGGSGDSAGLPAAFVWGAVGGSPAARPGA